MAVFYIYCWGKVTLKTCALWKQSYFFVSGMQFFTMTSSRKNTDPVISLGMSGQTGVEETCTVGNIDLRFIFVTVHCHPVL